MNDPAPKPMPYFLDNWDRLIMRRVDDPSQPNGFYVYAVATYHDDEHARLIVEALCRPNPETQAVAPVESVPVSALRELEKEMRDMQTESSVYWADRLSAVIKGDEDVSAPLTGEDMRHVLFKACEKLGSQKAWADGHGVSETYVSDILARRREVSAEIALFLGYHKQTIYTKDKP